MRFVLESAAKDLRRRAADYPAIFIWIGLPILIGGLLSLLGLGGGGTPTALLLIVDQDDSFISNLLAGAGDQGELGEFLRTENVSLQEGRERIDDGDGSALLIIPEGFGEAVLLDEPAELTLITNPAQTILPGIIEEGLTLLLDATFYAQRLVGEPLREVIDLDSPDSGPSLEQVTLLSTQFYQRIEGIEGLVFPPALQLEQEPSPEPETEEEEDDGGFDVAQFIIPMLLFMSILFVAQGMSDDLWHESRQGTLRRLLASPRAAESLLAGKVLAGVVIIAAVTIVALAVVRLRLGVELVRLPGALVWCVFSGGVLLTYFMAAQSLASSQRGASIIGNLILFPMMMLGGSFFPFVAMPGWMAAIGRRTPNGMALTQLEQLLFDTPELSSLLGATVIIAVPAIGAFLLTAARMRRQPLVGS